MRTRSWASMAGVVVALAWVGTAPLQAQATQAKADPALADWGERAWNMMQCYGCHELGRQQSTGPDLIGVTDRRSVEWLRKWLKNPIEMAADDSAAAALKREYNSQMPNMGLSDHDIDGLIQFLELRTMEKTQSKS